MNRRLAIADCKTPEEAYWAFFERFNAQDPAGWAGVMSYPHVRVSAGPPSSKRGRFFHPRTTARIYPDHADYADTAESMGWQRFIATGWVRTQGLEPVRIHESEKMVVLAGGWTRRRADGSPIVSNRVFYTLTRIDGDWGIQARFGVDSFDDSKDRGTQSSEAIDSVNARLHASRAGDFDTWLTFFHFPLTAVLAPGRVEVFECPAELRAAGELWTGETVPARHRIKATSAGATGVLLALHPRPASGGRRQVELLAKRNGAWKTLALAVLD